MGYTHYWTQRRDYGADAWAEVTSDMQTLLGFIEHGQDIRLCNGSGDRGTSPEFTPDHIAFNGSGDDAHETFIIYRKRPAKETWQRVRGTDFCKTAQKPYDLAVTAALCYLGTVAETHSVTSDGNGHDWLRGLEVARMALPQRGNTLDIPREILENDRWCGPWASLRTEAYSLVCCVDGHAYAIRSKDGASYRFETHRELGEWMGTHIEPYSHVDAFSSREREGGRSIFNASGRFDQKRMARLARAQSRVLGELVRYAPMLGRDQAPPATVRPGEMVAIEPAYSFADMLREV